MTNHDHRQCHESTAKVSGGKDIAKLKDSFKAPHFSSDPLDANGILRSVMLSKTPRTEYGCYDVLYFICPLFCRMLLQPNTHHYDYAPKI